jgi:peptide chain release factor
VESERSQHANKRLAKALIFKKLEELKESKISQNDKARWQQHWDLKRGNPDHIFIGEKFRRS